MTLPRHLLLVAHAFPPSGGAAVQRPTKFVKYLPAEGWRPTVLTVPDGYYQLRDESLVGDLPPEARVLRARTFEPTVRAAVALNPVDGARTLKHRLLRTAYDLTVVPDRSVLWLPSAFAAALRLAAADPVDAILATGNPYSSFILAALLGAALRRPFVVDYQDPWTLNPYSQRFSRGSHPVRSRVERLQERLVVERAAAALFVSDQVRDDHVAAHPDLAARFVVIPNGFDPADFADVPPKQLDGFSLVYTGKFTHYRRPDDFLRGFALARQREPAFAAPARLVFVGQWDPGHQRLADELGIGDAIVAPGFVPHRDAIAYMRGASALALISGTDRTEQTGKVFEFLAADRPIVAPVLPGGAVDDVLRHTGGAYFCDPHDPASIADALLHAWRDGDAARRPDPAARARYDRRAQTAALAKLLDRLT
jgi:glycosyltransferase involved in cell wall biosynthesis